ncbi:hypothetical protein BLA18110_05364 [Burkholderia lata]|uniref:hypothetical protein n=1 Tax=Burkholderia lata (strain ATCC 17760 / DSM 23089 / LMG 22485 / NCIMB 9086 / R18194 / 383) TaxID=482957 RepID=UPI0014540614|nr:hypothetical protein [Burkholderia lata]VWD20180.1 hypothetical protein BLA18110_05364 [Burkholderia lata]
MFYRNIDGYDVYLYVEVKNHGFAGINGRPEIFGFRITAVPTGLPENSLEAQRKTCEPEEGYRRHDLAFAIAVEVAGQFVLSLPQVRR